MGTADRIVPFENVHMPDNRMHEHPIIAAVSFTTDSFNPLSFSFAGFNLSINAVSDGGWFTLDIGIENDSHEVILGCMLELYSVRGEKLSLYTTQEILGDHINITFKRVPPDRYLLVIN